MILVIIIVFVLIAVIAKRGKKVKKKLDEEQRKEQERSREDLVGVTIKPQESAALFASASQITPAPAVLQLQAANIIAGGLRELGLMKGDVKEVVKQGAHAIFFPHGLGHMMGIDVHDMEDLGENFVGYDEETTRSTQFGLSFLRLGKRLQENYVLTVEPGIYFIPTLIDQWKSEKKFFEFINYDKIEAYKDFGGIRIEDDILVTSEGCRVLGKPIPKTVDEIEEIMK